MRRLPSEYSKHIKQKTTTLCRILKVTLEDGKVLGFSGGVSDVVVDGVKYYSQNGMDTKIIAKQDDLSVDNSEAIVLLSLRGQDLSYESVVNGLFDNSRWSLYEVNYFDTSERLLLDEGYVGSVSTTDGLFMAIELLSYSTQLQENIGVLDSIRCRAIFGTVRDSIRGCGVDTTGMWKSGVVTGIGEDPYLIFADSSTPIDEEMVVGRVRFTSGENKSKRLYQVEAYSNISGTVVLIEKTNFEIKVGDTFEIRHDCGKIPSECKKYNNYINYNGEPNIPVADGLEGATPNAQLTGGVQGGAEIEE